MYSFAVTIHRRPAEVATVETCTLRGVSLTTLKIAPANLGLGFDRTFEEVGEALASFERLYFEPDGSLVWVSSAGEAPWQLDGMLYDRDGRVLYLDLKGTCPPAVLDRLLKALGSPPAGVVFQLTQEAVFFDEVEFRRYAIAAG